MRKTDQSIHNIVTAAIKRASMDIDEWPKTRLWDTGDDALKEFLSNKCEFTEGEIPIIYFYENLDNWTVFSTRAIYYAQTGDFGIIAVADMESHHIDIKAFKHEGQNSIMEIVAKNGERHEVLYETGKPSMGAIYAIRTLAQVS